jgi:hypothetical protein
VTFVIVPFWDTVVCGVSSLECDDMLLGIPYQQDWNIFYHAKFNKYHLQHEGRTYVLTSSTPQSKQPMTRQAVVKQVSMNKYVSLCLVRPIKLDHMSIPTPEDMAPQLPEIANKFPQPTGLPLSFSIEHSIDIILEASFPNAPSYHLSPQEVNVITHQPDQLLNLDPTPPSSFPFASPTFLMLKHVFVPIVSTNRLCTPKQVLACYTLFLAIPLFPNKLLRKLQGNRIFTNAV